MREVKLPESLRNWAVPLALSAACALAPLPASAQPSPAAVYGYTYVPPVVTGSPRILKVELNSDRLRAGGPIAIRVTTTPDVVEVVTGNGPRQGTLTKTGTGVFTSTSTLPGLGGIAWIKITLHFAATAANGQTTTADVPVHYR